MTMTMPISRRGLLAGALAAGTMPAAAAPRRTLRVMTFNVRVPVDREPERTWDARRPVAVAMLRRTAPDLIGTQELVRRQAEDLVAALPAYAWFGRDRQGGHDDEHMGIFYRRDRLRLVEQGDFWLSDTPSMPGSITWGHRHPRMVTWGRFETLGGARRQFHALNTHFPYRAEDAVARMKCAEAILAYVRTLPSALPVVLTGDFNTDAADPVHARLASLLPDAREVAARVTGPAATFNGFGEGNDPRRLDWIMTRGFAPRSVTTIDDRDGKVWPSDHRPVLAELDWR